MNDLRSASYFLDVQGITIDEPWSSDLDDALWASPADDGSIMVQVTIASVSRTVVAGTELDVIARERITTKYYAHSHSSMLPRGVEEKLSLLPGVDRRGVTVEMIFNAEGELGSVFICPSWIRSTARVSYAEVPEILSSKGHALHEPMARLMKVASGLLAQRRRRGAFVLYDLTHGWVASEEGHVRKLERSAEVAGHIIVQELMVAANAAVASYAVEHGIPILFRNHQAVGTPDRAGLVALLEAATTSGASVDWLEEVRRTTGRSMHRAEYGAISVGHYGLNLPHYCHFTSPIRRYADLLTHRQILAHVLGEERAHDVDAVRQIADHINSTQAIEREAVSNRAKEKATDEAQRVLDSGAARHLEALGNKDFERAVKVVVRSGEDCPEAFVDAYVRRLQQHRVSVLAKTLVLLDRTSSGPRWKKLRWAVLNHVVQHIHEATSIVTMAKDVIEGWAPPTLSEKSEGPSHAPVFSATLVHPSWPDLTNCVALGRTSKEASQRAAMFMLASLAGVELPPFPELPPPAAPTVPEPVAKPSAQGPQGKDPIMVLGEHAQKHGHAMPVYDFTSSGPSNTPTIVCTCRYLGRKTDAKGGRKQDTKRAAASVMLFAIGAHQGEEATGA